MCTRYHRLKSWPEHFQAVKSEAKTFELRRDDRNFEVGDVLILQEWDPGRAWAGVEVAYTGPSLMRKISHIMRGPGLGLEAGFCIMSIAPEGEPWQ